MRAPREGAVLTMINSAPAVLLTAMFDAAVRAAAAVARDHGVALIVLGDAIEGEARDVAAAQAARTLIEKRARPFVMISGGETTVTVRETGRGGRNSEYLLALAVALNGAPGIHAIAADTDGIDGAETNAGAIIGPDTLARARALGLDPARMLADNDAFGFSPRSAIL